MEMSNMEIVKSTDSNLQLGKSELLPNAYASIQVSSKYMKEHHHEFAIKTFKQRHLGGK